MTVDTAEKYQILASGNVLAGYSLDEVKAAFSKKFGVKPELVDQYFNGREKIIKKGLDEATAKKYEAALVNMGVDAAIKKIAPPKPESAIDSLSLVPIGNEPTGSTETKPVVMTCPKCGLEQPKAIGCEGCGIIIEKYENAQLALQQVASKQKSTGVRSAVSGTGENAAANSKGTLDGAAGAVKTGISVGFLTVKKVFFTLLALFFIGRIVLQGLGFFADPLLESLYRDDLDTLCEEQASCLAIVEQQFQDCYQQARPDDYLNASAEQEDAELERFEQSLYTCFVDAQGAPQFTYIPESVLQQLGE